MKEVIKSNIEIAIEAANRTYNLAPIYSQPHPTIPERLIFIYWSAPEYFELQRG